MMIDRRGNQRRHERTENNNRDACDSRLPPAKLDPPAGCPQGPASIVSK